MSVLIYLHGFLSAPESTKARTTERWLSENRPDIEYLCPRLSSYPGEAKNVLAQLIAEYSQSKPMLIGSSLGGYWATWLAEMYDLPAVLVNPAVRPSMLLPEYLGVEFRNYYTDETYVLNQQDLDRLLDADRPDVANTENYWLLQQTDDETLDYQLAVKKYQDCRQLVEEGGNHSFANFERWLPSIIGFLERRRNQLLG